MLRNHCFFGIVLISEQGVSYRDVPLAYLLVTGHMTCSFQLSLSILRAGKPRGIQSDGFQSHSQIGCTINPEWSLKR